VNDGSRDDTAGIVRGYVDKNPRLHLLENPGNRSTGYSVRNGMLHAQGEILPFSDADLSPPIDEAEKLLAVLQDGADIAIGSRRLRSDLQNSTSTALPAALRARFQLAASHIGSEFQRYAVRIQSIHPSAAQAIFPQQRTERWGCRFRL
jgi:glycosyltransferase involved in cell wall biosynthesis